MSRRSLRAGGLVALAVRLAARRRRRVTGARISCRQCGAWESVHVLRHGRRRIRYWCERCGAVDRAALSALTTAEPGLTRPDLVGVMPAAMVRWLDDAKLRPPQLDQLTRRGLYDLYRRWDQATGSSLPAFSSVVDAMHDACYRRDVVAQRLGPPSPALNERIGHAQRWLALRASELCWIVRRLPDGQLATPEPETVQPALAALRSGATPGLATVRAAVAALFGTYTGPSWPQLLAAFPADELARGLRAYLDSGARPLREEVLANLAAGGGSAQP